MLGLVEFCERVTLFPATRANAVEDAVFAVPEVAPPAIDVILVNTVPPPEGEGPIIVIAGLVLFCDKVMLLPAKNGHAEEEAVLAVPTVAPPAAVVIETKVE